MPESQPAVRSEPDAIAVAALVGAHGVRGWVRVHLYDPKSTALRRNLVLNLRSANLPPLKLKIVALDPVPGKPVWRVQLEGITDRDQAEALRGREVWIARANLPALKKDEFYLADVVGLPVERVRPDGSVQALGTVVGLTSNGAQDLLEVEFQAPGKRPDTWLLPALPQFIVEVERRLLVELPLGMLPDVLAGDDEIVEDDGPDAEGQEPEGSEEPEA